MNCKRFVFSLVVCAAVLAIGTVPGTAQLQTQLAADIPFDFNVGNERLPAGSYIVQALGPSGAYLISEVGGAGKRFIQPMKVHRPSADAQTGELVFNSYGDSRFLAKVWRPGSTSGVELRQSSSEREMARNSTAQRVAVTLDAR